jgi:hypothetical protein
MMLWLLLEKTGYAYARQRVHILLLRDSIALLMCDFSVSQVSVRSLPGRGDLAEC